MPRVQGWGTGPWKLSAFAVQQFITGQGPLSLIPIAASTNTVVADTDPDVATIRLVDPATVPGTSVAVYNAGTSGNNVGVNDPSGAVPGNSTVADGITRIYQAIGSDWIEIANNT